MQNFALLSQWWNLIFVVPFCCGVLLVLLSLTGTGRHGRSGQRGAHRGSARPAAKHHAPRTHHKTSHAKAHKTNAQKQNAEHSTEQSAEPWSLMRALHLQNIPSQMLLQNFLLFWGVVGWTCNQIAAKSALNPAQFVVTSVLAALCGGFIFTLALSATMSRFMPEDETFAIHKADLEGRSGEAVSVISARSGSVYVRDASGTLHSIAARIRADDEPITRGTQVLVISYFADGDYFQVKQWSP